MGTVKNGTSRYHIKDYLANTVAPKYFKGLDNLNDLQIGLFGYITDALTEVTNDAYFTTASMYKESFPQLAELPESIYNHALIYELSNTFGTPASCEFTLLISEEAVINAGTVDGNYSYFDIDSGMVINVSELPFMLDYDIEIISKNTTAGWVHSAKYLINKKNSLGPINNPFIRSSIYISDNGNRYIAMQVKVHQVSKKSISDTIIGNDIINAVELSYTFSDQLANFDIYYKAPGAKNYIQLEKLLANSIKIENPFCFYKLIDDNTLQITFSNDDSYFQPEYNSDIIVELYTTKGSVGNFDEYTGDQISIAAKYDKYTSNRGIVFMGSVVGESTGGSDRKTVQQLKNETVKAYSTMKSFTTTNDLNLFFNDIRENSGRKSQILFMKKRDDVFERLYSAFILFRDKDNNVVPTNTLDIRVGSNDIDFTMKQTSRNIVKAGKVFKYIGDNTNPYAGIQPDLNYNSDFDQFENSTDFIYINPFLTIIATSPLSVGFYLNSISDTLPISAVETHTNSFYQFIIESISISRNALIGEDEYLISAKLSPTAILPKEAFTLVNDDTPIKDTDRTFVNETDDHIYIDNQNLKVIVSVLGKNNSCLMYVPLELVKFDSEYYYFEGKMKTNDYISSNGDLQIVEGFRTYDTYEDNSKDPILIPGTKCTLAVYSFYKYPDGTVEKTNFNKFDELKDFTLTNEYILKDQKANFVIPIEQIRSYVQYSVRETSGKYGFRLEGIPLIKANYMKLSGAREQLIKNFTAMYNYIEEAMDKLTNNYSIDMKFFNTYGYSEHYFLADDESDNKKHIDRVNIKLHFKAKFNISSNVEAEAENIKEYIKSLVEGTDLSLVSSPNFYLSTIVNKCINKYSTLTYLVFVGMNDYDSTIQALESDVNEYNVINGVISTTDIIPEYLNIDYLIKNGIRTPQITIDIV